MSIGTGCDRPRTEKSLERSARSASELTTLSNVLAVPLGLARELACHMHG